MIRLYKPICVPLSTAVWGAICPALRPAPKSSAVVAVRATGSLRKLLRRYSF